VAERARHAAELHKGAIPYGNCISVTYFICLDLVELIQNAFLCLQVEYKVDGRHIHFHPKIAHITLRQDLLESPDSDSMPNSSRLEDLLKSPRAESIPYSS
jgi:hypothetical protein